MENFKSDFLNARTITSAGGIVVAILSIWVLFKVFTNDFSHLTEQIRSDHAIDQEIQKETNTVLRDVATALEGNTRVIQNLK